MVALPFFDPDETPVDYSRPPTSDFIPEQAPPFDYDAPHYVLSSPKGSGHPEQKLTLSPLPLAKGANPSGMLPDDRPALDPATAGDAWATNEISEDGIPKHYALPTRPGDRPADDETGFRGDAVERYRQTGQFYGGPFDTDERAAEYMRTHAAQGPSLLRALTAPGESEIQAAQPMGDFPDPYVKQYREEQAERARKGEPEPESPVHPREGADAVLRQPATPDLGRALNLRPWEYKEPLALVAANRIGENVKSYYDQYKGDLNAVWKAFQADVKASVPDEKAFHDANFWDATKMQVDAQLAAGKTVADAFGLGMTATVGGALRVGTKATGQFFHMLFPGAASEEGIQSALDEASFAMAPEKGIGDFPGVINTTPHEAFFPYRDATAARPSVSLGDVVGKPSDRGLINQRLPDLLNRPDPRFQGIARERALRQGERVPGQYGDEDPRFQQRRADDANVWSVENPMFFSAVEDVIKNGDNKAPPDDWYNRIKGKPGIKEEELETIGLRGWLDEQKAAGRKSITKQEILDYVQAHNIEIEETVLGGHNPRVEAQYDRLSKERRDLSRNIARQQQDIMDAAEKERENLLAQHKADSLTKDRELMDAGRWQEANEHLEQRKYAEDQAQARADDIMAQARAKADEVQDKAQDQYDAIDAQMNDLRPRMNNPHADYSGYAHPGENYRIVLLRVKRPAISTAKVEAAAQAADAAYQALVNELHRTTPGLDAYDISNFLTGVRDGSIHAGRLQYLRERMPDTADSLIDNVQKTYAEHRAEQAKQPRLFTESHWPSHPDIVAHYRLVDVVDPVTGEKRTVVVEKQSDIHQKAAKGRGYEGVTNTPAAKAAAQKALEDATTTLKQEQSRIAQAVSEGRYTSKEDLFLDGTDAERRAFQTQELEDAAHKNADKAFRSAQEQVVTASGAHPEGPPLPNLPYKQTDAWTTLIAKSVLRRAAEEGLDKVSFDVGQTNVNRYEDYLVRHIDQITYNPLPDGRFDLHIRERNGGSGGTLSKPYTIAEVVEKFGQDIARDMVNRVGDKDIRRSGYGSDQDTSRPEFGQPYVLRNINKTTGHEGMLEYYDRIARKAINKYVNKWKVQLDDNDTIQTGANNWEIEHEPGRDPEPQLRDDIPEEDPDHPDYDPDYERTEDDYYYNDEDYEPEQWVLHRNNRDHEYYDSESEAQDALAEKLEDTPVRTLDIPDALKKDVMEKGQPRFQQRRSGPSGPILASPGARTWYDRNSAGRKVAELAFTPEMMVQRVALAQDLRQRLDALGLHDIALRVSDAIYALDRDGLRIPDIQSDGYYLHEIINVALSQDPMGTLNHEAIHAMRDLGLFKKKEWKTLEDAADKVWREHHKIADVYGHLSIERQREEAIAYAFDKWAADRAAAPQGSFVQQAMQRVQDFLAAIKSGFTGRGFHTPESIFRKIDSGKIGQRKALERGLINTDDIAFQSHAAPAQPIFYSGLARFIGKQNKQSAQQWINSLENKAKDGVIKNAEIEWYDIKDWLRQQQGSVTPQQLLDHIKNQQLELTEVYHGAADPKLVDEKTRLEAEHQSLVDEHRELFANGRRGEANALLPRMNDVNDRLINVHAQINRTPRAIYAPRYVLHGGQNAREMQMALPLNPNVAVDVHDMRYLGGGDFRLWNNLTNDYHRVPDTGREWRGYSNREDAQINADQINNHFEGNFVGAHYRKPNIVAHVRFDDRVGPNGEKQLHIAEFQSDWAAEGREHGFRDLKTSQAKLDRANAAKDAALNRLDEARTRIVKEASGGEYETTTEILNDGTMDMMRQYHRLDADDPELNAARAEYDKVIKDWRRARMGGGLIPDMPFKENYHELALKRMLRYAAENGYDSLSWDTGETNNARYPRFDAAEAAKQKAGMEKFYDKDLVKFLNKYADKQKWKTQVETSTIPINREGWHITPPEQTTSGRWMVKSSDYLSYGEHFDTEAEAKAFLESKLDHKRVHRIVLTEALKQDVMQGQAMFKRRGMINTTVH